MVFRFVIICQITQGFCFHQCLLRTRIRTPEIIDKGVDTDRPTRPGFMEDPLAAIVRTGLAVRLQLLARKFGFICTKVVVLCVFGCRSAGDSWHGPGSARHRSSTRLSTCLRSDIAAPTRCPAPNDEGPARSLNTPRNDQRRDPLQLQRDRPRRFIRYRDSSDVSLRTAPDSLKSAKRHPRC